MTTGYFTHPDCARHDMGPGHPECPQRLAAIEDRLIAAGLAPLLARPEVPLASESELLRAHTERHVRSIREHGRLAEQQGRVWIDADTAMNAHSWTAALRAAGAAVAATDAVIAGELANAFCAVRPPGHHAMRDRAMGFCLFNNVAIAALHALEAHGLERVAIVDFDVHHGNGTEDIFAGDPRVLMVGLFQHPFYPFSGAPPAAANMHNAPLPAYTRGDAVRRLVVEQWLPALREFAPQMLFISAGFDAHRDDELGQLGLVDDDFAWITRELVRFAAEACQGRIVSCLEGGYDLDALGRSVAVHLRELAGLG